MLKYQQIDGLNTVLPIGTRKINAFRTLTTESLAVFMPFKVQEIMDRGGIYFGENAISHNLIMCNKANLLNQSSFRLGVPGSGKSFSVKEEIVFLILNTDDDILIADPEGEYAPLIEAMDGVGSVIGRRPRRSFLRPPRRCGRPPSAGGWRWSCRSGRSHAWPRQWPRRCGG